MHLNSLDLPGRPEDTRIVVALSGGVDSSVVAALLKQEGYNVIGITLQLYDHGSAIQRPGSCCAGQDIEDARQLCELLNIPHYVLDYEARFQETVMTPFAESYLNGETPVPCISCNQTVKFADLLKTAHSLGAQALATGHYIKTVALGAHRALYRPIDTERDQSYFLFATTQEQIDYLRFPLGNLSKAQVRAIAAEMGLSVAQKRDSQDICFVPQGRYADVILRLKPAAHQSGVILHIDGYEVGHHNGIVNFTIGQRRGIGVALGEPLYVIALDAQNAKVIVGPKEALEIHKLYLRDLNWLGEGDLSTFPATGIEISAKVRSTRPPCPALLHYHDGQFSVQFPEGESSVAPGQACVFYSDTTDNARILGGGYITYAEKMPEIEAKLKQILGNNS